MEMTGPVETTLKLTPLLGKPPTSKDTFPLVAPLGTATVMLDGPQILGVAGVPWKLTCPVAEPKFVPVILTDVPTMPEDGERLVIMGSGALPHAGRTSTVLRS